MALPFDKQRAIPRPISRPIASPALAPNEFERAGETELTIALVNNMPDSALKATERQFMRLVQGAAGKRRIRFRCFALPSVARSRKAMKGTAAPSSAPTSEMRQAPICAPAVKVPSASSTIIMSPEAIAFMTFATSGI